MTTTSSATFHRALRVLPGGTTRSTTFVRPHPPYAVSGLGCRVTDSDGHTVIDCNNNYTALIHGHADAELLEIAYDTARRGSAFGLPTPLEVDMGEHLRQRTGIENWRFCNSGTEAVMMLFRAARAATGRDIVIRFEGSYHGTYEAVVSPVGAPGIPGSTYESVLILPQQDLGALENAMATLGDRVAAVLIDLMPNRAGMMPANPAYVRRLRELTTAHGALLAVDEVISFRLGYGGFHQSYGITPDLISVAKMIGGGYPVGAIGGSAEVLSSFSPLGDGNISWGGTFSANPVTLATGLAALRRFDRTASDILNALGDQLRDRLHEAGIVANGSGSLVRIMLDDPESAWWSLYSKGVLAASNGMLALSTAMTEEDVNSVASSILGAEGIIRN